jgi:hypothetical protein
MFNLYELLLSDVVELSSAAAEEAVDGGLAAATRPGVALMTKGCVN